jgi:hypothetical protein
VRGAVGEQHTASALTRLLIAGRRHLTVVLDEYVGHYNRHRPHQSPNQPPPHPRRAAPASSGWKVRRGPVLGGLINEVRPSCVTRSTPSSGVESWF